VIDTSPRRSDGTLASYACNIRGKSLAFPKNLKIIKKLKKKENLCAIQLIKKGCMQRKEF